MAQRREGRLRDVYQNFRDSEIHTREITKIE